MVGVELGELDGLCGVAKGGSRGRIVYLKVRAGRHCARTQVVEVFWCGSMQRKEACFDLALHTASN